MLKEFQVAAGSVTGRRHRKTEKNNQDHVELAIDDDLLIGVVADGCGSSLRSEVGAYLGPRLLVESLRRQLSTTVCPDEHVLRQVLRQARSDVLASLRVLANSLTADIQHEVFNSFLFTLLGVIARDQWISLFSLGDGYLFLNGSPLTCLSEDNRPPYLGYALVPSVVDVEPDHLHFKIHLFRSLDTIHSILLATDGLRDLIRCRDKCLPGKREPVGDVRQFWEHDAYFDNPDAINRRLRLVNREVRRISGSSDQGALHPERPRLITHGGLLEDDTSILVMRRRPQCTSISTIQGYG